MQGLWPALSSLTDNLTKGLNKGKCKDYKSSLEYMAAKESLLTFKCKDYNITCVKKFGEDLSKRCWNTYRFCDGDLNKCCLILPKGMHTSTWMAGKDSVKSHCLHRRKFTATRQWRASQTQTTNMLRLGKLWTRPISWSVYTKWYPAAFELILKF